MGGTAGSFSGGKLPKWHQRCRVLSPTQARSVSMHREVSRQAADLLFVLNTPNACRFCSCWVFVHVVHSCQLHHESSHGLNVTTLPLVICTRWWKSMFLWQYLTLLLLINAQICKGTVNLKTRHCVMYTNPVTFHCTCMETALIWNQSTKKKKPSSWIWGTADSWEIKQFWATRHHWGLPNPSLHRVLWSSQMTFYCGLQW